MKRMDMAAPTVFMSKTAGDRCQTPSLRSVKSSTAVDLRDD